VQHTPVSGDSLVQVLDEAISGSFNTTFTPLTGLVTALPTASTAVEPTWPSAFKAPSAADRKAMAKG